MRIITTIFLGSIATLTVLTAPALARTSDAQKTDNKPISSSCHSYVQNPDGSWKPLPCEEIGAEAKSRRKSATQGTDETTH